MPTDRAGYNLTVFALDVSASMGEQVAMGDEGVKRSKLDLAREYIARSCEPRVRVFDDGSRSASISE
jgi:ATP-dependent DNA helicase 2 subunit 2